MGKLTIVGCGDVGSRLALAALKAGESVTGWVRSHTSLQRLQALQIPALRVDLDFEVETAPELTGDRLIHLAPPPASGREDTRVGRLIRHMHRTGAAARVVYLSTSGVYGDCRGEWVDETRRPAPLTERAQRRLDAELKWRAWSHETGAELVILRVAGIYGPGKLPVKRLQRGEPMVSEAESPITNHIHSADLVQICLAAMARGRSGEVYNVSDGHPGTMSGYFNQVADFLKLPRPPVISRAEALQRLSPGMRSYLVESRRLSNHKLLEQLGVELRYPTLAEGLPASLPPADASVSRA